MKELLNLKLVCTKCRNLIECRIIDWDKKISKKELIKRRIIKDD